MALTARRDSDRESAEEARAAVRVVNMQVVEVWSSLQAALRSRIALEARLTAELGALAEAQLAVKAAEEARRAAWTSSESEMGLRARD